MITADTILCRIPTEYAIKIKELSCTVAHPVDSADSQTWATWTTAAVTLLAVIAAALAWREARAANRATARNLHTQLQEQKNLALHQMEIEQLAKFSETLLWFVNNVLVQAKNTIDDLESNDLKREHRAKQEVAQALEARCRELVSSWMTWSMFLITTDDDFREATNTVLTQTQETAKEISQMQIDSCLESGQGRGMLGQLQKTVYIGKLEALIENTGSIIANIQFIRQQGENWENLRAHIIKTYPKMPLRQADNNPPASQGEK